MYANKLVLSVIQIVTSQAQIKIQDTDRIDLLHLFVRVAQTDMFCDGFSHSIKHPLQVIQFTGVLHLDNNNLPLAVTGLYVYTVKLVVRRELVTFAFQYLDDSYGFSQEHRQKPLQHTEISFLPQQTFDGPIETDIFVFQITHNTLVIIISRTKIKFLQEMLKSEQKKIRRCFRFSG